MSEFLFTATPNADAIRFIKEKPVVSREVFDGLLPELKARAFAVTGLESPSILKKLRDRIADLPAGAAWADVKGDIAARLSPFVTTADDPTAATRRATTMLRMHGFQSYAVAQERVAQRQKDVFPFAQYADADDPRVRPAHAALDGIVLPVDSEFWRDHTGPWEWGCRCRKIFLSSDDVADLEHEDARKIPEARRVITGARRDKLEKEGTFLTAENGVPRSIDVRSPRAKFGGSAYSFDPTSIDLDLPALKERYKPEVWAKFETWAKATPIPDQKRTVWEWLEKKPGTAPRIAPPKIAPIAKVVPAPAPVPPASPISPVSPSLPLQKAPVSAALELKVRGPHLEQIRTAISAVDRVHDDGLLKPIPVLGSPSRGALGSYAHTASGLPAEIRIAHTVQPSWPAMTTAHEIGHMLDHQVLGEAGVFASVAAPELAEFRAAVRATRAVAQIAALGAGQRGNFLRMVELWARAYAQYIAVRSQDPVMLEQLQRILSGRQPWRQWEADDFVAVAASIDTLFKAKGWIS